MRPISFRGFALNDDGVAAAFDRSFQRPGMSPILVRRQGKRPLTTGVELDEWQLPNLGALIVAAAEDEEALQLGLLQAFDTTAGPGALIVADGDGNERSLYATCRELTQKSGETGLGFVATLVAADDVYWSSILPSNASTTMNAAVKTLTVTNTGHVDIPADISVYESVSLTGATWRYRRFIPIRWLGDGTRGYPYELTDGAGLNTAALVSGGKATTQSNLTVIVDGRHANRWYANSSGSTGGFNMTNTRVWVNLDFQTAAALPLAAQYTGGLVVFINGDVGQYPAEGMVQIDNELFRYTGRDYYRNALTGVTRGIHDTTPVNHAAGAAVYWIQHEVWIAYGPSAVAPVTDDAYKPMIDLLNSSNQAWFWENFGSLASGDRTGQWSRLAGGMGELYTGDQHGAETDPFQVMGLARPGLGAGSPANYAEWRFYSPVGFQTLDWNGKIVTDPGFMRIEASADGATWVFVAAAGPASSDGVWTVFSDIAGSLSSAYRYVRVVPWNVGANDVEGQMSDFEMTFQSGLRPTSSLGGEQSNYQVSMLIENLTTGESLTIDLLPGLKHTAELAVVSGESKQAIILPGEHNIYQNVTRDALRPDFLRLVPGANSIRVTEANYAGEQVIFFFRPRWYL